MRPDPSQGVFETLLVRDGRLQALDLHLGRLERAVRELYRGRLPGDLPELVASHASALVGAHRLRIDAAADCTVTISSEPVDLDDRAPALVALSPLRVPGGLGPYKWRDRRLVEAVEGVALLLDVEEEVLEAARANVWIIEGDRLLTPPADGRILPGVTRSLVLELAAGLGHEAVVQAFSLERARRADGIFLTSSIRHAVGAILPDGQAGGGEPPDAQAGGGEPPVVERVRAALRFAA